MNKTFLITTPIYYPSGTLHIGHVYTTTLAWTIRNYKKQMGYDAMMITGADEHGQKIEIKALEAQMSPQAYVDKMNGTFVDLWSQLHIDFDFYSRTTNKEHEEAVAKQFSQLLKDGHIYKGKYKGLYSVSDEEFMTPTQAEKKDDGYYHPVSGHKLEEIEEESYFFKMSEFQDWLKEYIKSNPRFIFPKKIVKELMNNFIDVGLEDLSVSRNTFKWGIKIKEDPKHVMYVWLDALNNYITALGYNSSNQINFKKYWENGDEIVHLVGKEITRFHCIYWPIILKATNIKLPTTILSHGWIITPEGKMSKSKGNVVDPLVLIEKYGHEVVKYFFAAKISMGQDGIFSEEMLQGAYNTDLANTFGNLLSRTVAMTNQNFDKPIKFTKPAEQIDKELLNSIESHYSEYKREFDDFKVDKAIEAAILLAKECNGYIDRTMPWTLKENKERLSQVLNNLLNGIYAIATMLSVILPEKMEEAKKQLSVNALAFENILDFHKFDDTIVVKGTPLFERMK